MSPGSDVTDLWLGSFNATGVDEDTEDHLDVVGTGGSSDVLEGLTVGAVDADGCESLAGELADVGHDGGGVLAAGVVGVRGVGHAEFVAVGSEATG